MTITFDDPTDLLPWRVGDVFIHNKKKHTIKSIKGYDIFCQDGFKISNSDLLTQLRFSQNYSLGTASMIKRGPKK